MTPPDAPAIETCPTCGMAPSAGRHANYRYCGDPCHAPQPALDLPLPASLDDAHLVPWLVAIDYGDTDVMGVPRLWKHLAAHYADSAEQHRRLVARYMA